MAAPFSSSSHVKRSHVFPSFHGPDVRRGFLSHLHNLFAKKDITIFKDQEMDRGNTIAPMLVKAIREARVSIVLISKNYASSSWCLDELVEILKCKDVLGQIVVPVFYDVDPSDVRKQRGDFGIAFQKSCEGRANKDVHKWKKALAYIATIAGEHSHNWTDEAMMVEKLSIDVSNKLKVEELKEEFNSYDVDQNSFITAAELRYILTKDGDKVTDEQVSAIIRAADIDGDGQISYDEFVKITTIDEAGMVEKLSVDVSNKQKVEKIKEEFRRHDVDQNGFINAAELRYIMTIDGEKVTDELVCAYMQAADIDGDGQISYDEFVKHTILEQTAIEKMVDEMLLAQAKAAFRAADENRDGFLNATEVQHMTLRFGYTVTHEEAKMTIQELDVDGDGQLNFDEFLKQNDSKIKRK